MTTSLVLTAQSTVPCGHGGHASLSSVAKLRVGGSGVLTAADVKGKAITDCIVQTNVNIGTRQCGTVTTVTDATAKLAVAGVPVVRATLMGTTDGLPLPPPPATGQPLGKVLAGQAVLRSGTEGQP